MQIDIGRYTLDMDYDPREQNNASDKKIPIESIGFIYNCVFKQKAAFVQQAGGESAAELALGQPLRVFKRE